MGNWGLLMIARTLFGGQYSDFMLRVRGVQAQRAGFVQYVNAQVTGVLPISSLVFNRQPSAVKKDLEITY